MKSASPGYPTRRESDGFTLVEMLLVTGLLGVLLSLALPQYKTYVQRGQRVEAIRMLTTVAACQERHRASAGAYDTTQCLLVPDNEDYRLIIEPAANVSSDTYSLIAEPIDWGENEMCGSLSLDQAGTRAISGPSQNLHRCWSGR